jgi:hypothetical protein
LRARARPSCEITRRELLVAGLGWFPFFWRPREIRLAGAKFRIRRRGRSPHRYLLIHGNEQTARQVLEQHMRSHPGIAYIVEGSERNVGILGGVIDPNRMFSRVGAEASLEQLNPRWQPAEITRALGELDRGRQKLVKHFFPPGGSRLVALHNNSESYSVKDEIPLSGRTSIRQPENPHAFFLATDPADYAILAGSPYNVVLQERGPAADDGSLSRLAAKSKVRYINLEVALGEFDRQMEMLMWLESHLP